MVLRYYDGGTIHERFIYFEEAACLDAESLTPHINDTFERYRLNYETNLVW